MDKMVEKKLKKTSITFSKSRY